MIHSPISSFLRGLSVNLGVGWPVSCSPFWYAKESQLDDKKKAIDPEEVARAEKTRPRATSGRSSKARKKRLGRPEKITPELIDQIASVIEAGNYMETAAKYCGIDKQSLYTWLKKGNEQKAQGRRGLHRDFLDAIKKALAAAEARSVARIVKAGEAHWQAEAWRLERKHPKRWGRKDHLTAQVATGKATLIDLITASFARPGDGDDDSIEDAEQNATEVREELGDDA